MRKIKSNHIFIVIIGFIYLLALNSCTKNNVEKDTNHKQIENLINTIEDSLQTNPTLSKELSIKGVKSATDSIDKYRFNVLLGKSYYLLYQDDSMKFYINKALNFVNKKKTSDKKIFDIYAFSYETLASNFYLYRQSDSAIFYHKKAFQYQKRGTKPTFLPNIAANLADVYLQTEDMPSAAKWYREALLIADSLHIEKEKYTSLYMGLAQVYLYLRDYKQSEYFYKLAGKNFSILPVNLKSYYLNNYGNYFYYKKDYKNALAVFRELKTFLNKHPNIVYDNYLCKLNIADVFLNLNQPDSTRYYLEGCYDYFNKINVSDGIYYVNTQKIGIAIKENDMNKIKNIIQSERIKAPSDPNMIRIRNNYLREYYANTNNYKKAYETLLRYKTEDDSLDINRNRMRAAETIMRYHNDTLSLHKQLYLQKKNEEIKRVSLWLVLSIITSLFLVSITGFWILYYRKKRLQNELNIMELRLTNLRNRISPHFIFNVLNHEVENREKGKGGTELSNLALLLRESLNMTKQSFVSIRSELNFVDKYIQLESYIFDNDFSYNFKFELNDDSLLDREKIPSMFVQILTENAIKHGLKNKNGEKKLTIIVTNENDNIIIKVKDNGVGFNMSHNIGSTQVGLNVIRKTLVIVNQKHNKKKIKFSIHNIEDENHNINGCESILSIPIGLNLKENNI